MLKYTLFPFRYFYEMLFQRTSLFPLVFSVAMTTNLSASAEEDVRIRGEIIEFENEYITIQTEKKRGVQVHVSDSVSVFRLSKTSFADVDFGTYVGATSIRLDEYSPIVRDSMSWLHEGFELRIMDEDLRGIALGHSEWDLTPESVISHGWVDDLEIRVLSIKYGPTEEEETDVEIPRDVSVSRMSIGDQTLLKPSVNVFVGAQPRQGSKFEATYIIVGEDGLVPAL